MKSMRWTHILFTILSAPAAVVLVSGIAQAHVSVSPSTVPPASMQLFEIGVPTEKSGQTTSLKLTIPDGVTAIVPTVKAGWQVSVEKTGNKTTAITWSDGSIPSGQREDFSFMAQAPSKTTELHWKALQTYADGSTVSWDQAPSSHREPDDDTADSGPYAVTRIMDRADTSAAAPPKPADITLPVTLSLVATGIALLALYFATRPMRP